MKYIKKVSASYQGDTPIATSITSSSTNDEVAGAKAVYDITPKTVAVLKLGGNNVDNSFTISSVATPYTPLNVTTMTAIKTDTDYCSYNSSNGRLTFTKSCTLKVTLSTQIRSSNTSSSTTTPFINKGFGFRLFNSSGTAIDTGTVAETTVNAGYSNMSGIYYFSVNPNEYLIPMAYARTLEGSTSNSSIVWGYGRTSMTIELVEETTQTRSINLTKSSTEEETKEIEQPLEKEETIEVEKTTLQNEGSGDSK